MKIINVTSFTTFIDQPFIPFDGERYMADLYINVDQISHFQTSNQVDRNFRPTRINMLNGSHFKVAEAPSGIICLISKANGNSKYLSEECYIQPIEGEYVQHENHNITCPNGEERCEEGFLAEW